MEWIDYWIESFYHLLELFLAFALNVVIALILNQDFFKVFFSFQTNKQKGLWFALDVWIDLFVCLVIGLGYVMFLLSWVFPRYCLMTEFMICWIYGASECLCTTCGCVCCRRAKGWEVGLCLHQVTFPLSLHPSILVRMLRVDASQYRQDTARLRSSRSLSFKHSGCVSTQY